MREFSRIQRLPPYVLGIVNELKYEARRRGEDIIDFGLGNPDMPTPNHIVDKLIESAQKEANHRYSLSRGIYKLRLAITDWYKRNHDVDLDPNSEAIATIGSKEGIAHLAMAITSPGDSVLVPTPTYPIHTYAFILANADVIHVPLNPDVDFFESLLDAFKSNWPRPKAMVINFPHNPTTQVVDIDFFEKVVDFAKEHDLIVIHDFAYGDIVFDGYRAPSFLQVPGAKEVGIEFFSLSKSYNMPGWRVGFAVGNSEIIHALARIKSYQDYGMFQPIQIAATVALNGPRDCVEEIRDTYQQRRDVLCESLNRIGWEVTPPKATMMVWAEIPDRFKKMGSLEFCKLLLEKAKVAVAPGIGFGEGGDHFVRFSLVENEHRIRQAVRGIREIF
ncbi:MAG: alanine transaminase [Nitrospina sp.]|nr:alanine transaminase [Nitrospina sp.]MBT3414374.1 alanine transaminase [Nitrospina sp.]MBT3857610.1 alanine transaminase [Nitrospina sp.]MBT4103458.1 alanine transaminase [Nitrospina sp.]MBT4389123.1 alanine transaminase [Nitrospina sp.]